MLMNEFNKSFTQNTLDGSLLNTALYVSNAAKRPTASSETSEKHIGGEAREEGKGLR